MKTYVPDSDSDSDSSTDTDTYTHARIILHLLNEQTGKHFRESDSSLTPIADRLRESGVTLEGVKAMLSRQVAMWKGTEMAEYLRPETLFNKTKFNSYYAAKDQPLPKPHGTNRTTDKPNPRNDGTIAPTTDYGEAAKRKQDQQRRVLESEVAQDGPQPPSVENPG